MKKKKVNPALARALAEARKEWAALSPEQRAWFAKMVPLRSGGVVFTPEQRLAVLGMMMNKKQATVSRKVSGQTSAVKK